MKYLGKQHLTIEETGARTPLEALTHVTETALSVSKNWWLTEAEIKQTYLMRNSYDITAKFEWEGS